MYLKENVPLHFRMLALFLAYRSMVFRLVVALGLSINGVSVSGSTCLDWRELCYTLLGVVLEDPNISGQRIRLTLLSDHFSSLEPDADKCGSCASLC